MNPETLMTDSIRGSVHDWRAEATRLAVQLENLEHEVGTLREQLRRIKGYVNSVVTEGAPNDSVLP